jgi:predicted ferric reductase
MPRRNETAERRAGQRYAGWLGPALLGAVALGNVVIWLGARPAGGPTGRFIGELCGAEAVLLFSSSLVLTTLLPPIERAFDGLDRVAVWHRRAAVAGLVVLVGHLSLVTSPPDPFATAFGHALGDVALAGLLFLSVWALAPALRAARWPGPIRRLAQASYERWLGAHRLMGLFVAVAVAHGEIVDPVLHRSSTLRVVFSVVGATGIAAYLYRELIARFVVPTYEYRVGAVERLGETTVEVALQPVGRRLSFSPGQFVFVAFGGIDGWQRHPFSVSSAPDDGDLELTIKDLGDYTRDLLQALRPGVPAKLAGPFGTFDYRHGGHNQVWIAGGVGITPFLSWIRSLDGDFDRDVDFYYSYAGADEALHRDEIVAAATAHPSFRTHLVSSDRDGLLTADAVMAAVPAGGEPWIYMCGPPGMMRSLATGFRRMGVPRRRMRWEDFGPR